MMRSVIVISLAALALAGPSLAGPIEDADHAIHRHDYETAFKILRPLAEAGDPAAEFKLGSLYGAGTGVARDEREALAWRRKAAVQDYGPAKAWRLSMCVSGPLLPADDCNKAVTGLRAEADKGSAQAQYKLGLLLLLGKAGLPVSPEEGVALIRKAADQGLADAQSQLGLIYASNFLGVPEDQRQSISWYSKAADQGDPTALDVLATDYRLGIHGLPKDSGQAANLYKRAADKGDPIAQTALANMYERGNGVPQDDRQAFYWYRKLADQGAPDAAVKVGTDYALGKGVSQDFVQAYAWIDVALSRRDGEWTDSNGLLLNSVVVHLSPAQLQEAKDQAEQLGREIQSGASAPQ